MIETMKFDALEPEVLVTLNVPYAWVPDRYGAGSNALHMHIVYPKEAPEGGLPVLLWVCGGGWECCEPQNRLHDLGYFAERGYLVCLMQYRVSNTAPLPAQIRDVKTAIRFIRSNADKFRADPDRIAIMGDSAGGHLATLAGLTPDKPEFTGDQWPGASDRVQAVINWYGAVDFYGMMREYGLTDLAQLPGNNCVSKLFDGELDQKGDLIRLANAIDYVSPDAPPFLILHGDKDESVPVSLSYDLHGRLEAAGCDATLVIVKGAGHATVEFAQKKLLRRIADWLDRAM